MQINGKLHAPAALPLAQNNTRSAGCVGRRTGLDVLERIKSLAPSGIRTLNRSVRSVIATPTELRWLFPGVQPPGREASHSPPSRAEVKNV